MVIICNYANNGNNGGFMDFTYPILLTIAMQRQTWYIFVERRTRICLQGKELTGHPLLFPLGFAKDHGLQKQFVVFVRIQKEPMVSRNKRIIRSFHPIPRI